MLHFRPPPCPLLRSSGGLITPQAVQSWLREKALQPGSFLILSLTNCLTLGNLFNLSAPQFPPLSRAKNSYLPQNPVVLSEGTWPLKPSLVHEVPNTVTTRRQGKPGPLFLLIQCREMELIIKGARPSKAGLSHIPQTAYAYHLLQENTGEML